MHVVCGQRVRGRRFITETKTNKQGMCSSYSLLASSSYPLRTRLVCIVTSLILHGMRIITYLSQERVRECQPDRRTPFYSSWPVLDCLLCLNVAKAEKTTFIWIRGMEGRVTLFLFIFILFYFRRCMPSCLYVLRPFSLFSLPF